MIEKKDRVEASTGDTGERIPETSTVGVGKDERSNEISTGQAEERSA